MTRLRTVDSKDGVCCLGVTKGWICNLLILSLFVLCKFNIHFIFFILNTDRAGELPKLVEDLIQTSISTGPRGAFRMAQGIQAVLGVGGEWLNDLSKVWLSLFYAFILSLHICCDWKCKCSIALPKEG